MKSGPWPVALMRCASCSQNGCSPTADLIPTGSPVASASVSQKSTSPSTLWNAEWLGGLWQSTPASHAAAARDLRVHLRRGHEAADPGLRALRQLDLQRPHRRARNRLEQVLEVEAPGRVAAAEVPGPDLEDQVAAVAVVVGDAALAGVLQARRHRRAAVERLDRRRRERAEAHAADVDDGLRAEGVGPSVQRAEDLAGGQQVLGRASRSRRPCGGGDGNASGLTIR